MRKKTRKPRIIDNCSKILCVYIYVNIQYMSVNRRWTFISLKPCTWERDSGVNVKQQHANPSRCYNKSFPSTSIIHSVSEWRPRCAFTKCHRWEQRKCGLIIGPSHQSEQNISTKSWLQICAGWNPTDNYESTPRTLSIPKWSRGERRCKWWRGSAEIHRKINEIQSSTWCRWGRRKRRMDGSAGSG